MSVVYRVINQKLYRHNPREVIATDQFGFVEVEVRFEGWDDYENKRIQFIQKDRILNRLLVDNKCKLPMELAVGMFQVTVIGTQPNGLRATTQVLHDLIVASGYQEGGDPPVPPTPDLYAQLLQKIEDAEGSSEEHARAAAESAQQAKTSAEQAVEAASQAATSAESASDDADRAAISAAAAQQAALDMSFVSFEFDREGNLLIKNPHLLGTTSFRLNYDNGNLEVRI